MELSKSNIAKKLGISRPTLDKYLECGLPKQYLLKEMSINQLLRYKAELSYKIDKNKLDIDRLKIDLDYLLSEEKSLNEELDNVQKYINKKGNNL